MVDSFYIIGYYLVFIILFIIINYKGTSNLELTFKV